MEAIRWCNVRKEQSQTAASDLLSAQFSKTPVGNVKRTGLTISRAQRRSTCLQSRAHRAANETNGIRDNDRPVGIVAALGLREEVFEIDVSLKGLCVAKIELFLSLNSIWNKNSVILILCYLWKMQSPLSIVSLLLLSSSLLLSLLSLFLVLILLVLSLL